MKEFLICTIYLPDGTYRTCKRTALNRAKIALCGWLFKTIKFDDILVVETHAGVSSGRE